jgi:3-oxoacyl-[acyl-carrier protein] reductase
LDFQGKTAIITGAGRGIGRAIALGLAAQGADVCLVSRTKTELEQLAGEIELMGRKAIVMVGDVSLEKDVRSIVDRVTRESLSIDILINNAGVGYFSPVNEMKTAQFDAMWAVNMRGVFLFSREVLPVMMKQQSGDILNISSLAGRNSFIGGAGYSATKWALIGFSRSMMLEVREKNIRVITICPGSVDTSFGDQGAQKIKSKGLIPTAEDIARVVIDTLRMPRHVMVSEVDIRPTNPKS